MSNTPSNFIPWWQRGYLSLDEVGVIFGRSSDWARSRINDGHLEGVRLLRGGPMMVRVPSAIELIAKIDAQSLQPTPTAKPVEQAPRAYPRLAWVNPHSVN